MTGLCVGVARGVFIHLGPCGGVVGFVWWCGYGCVVEWLGLCSHSLGVCLCGLDFLLAWLSSVWGHGWGVY